MNMDSGSENPKLRSYESESFPAYPIGCIYIMQIYMLMSESHGHPSIKMPGTWDNKCKRISSHIPGIMLIIYRNVPEPVYVLSQLL